MMPYTRFVAEEVRVIAKQIGSYRWWICALLFFATTINYMDRQVIGLLKPTLSKELHWNESDFASLVFWFQAAYAGGYLFGGRLMDLIGVRIGYTLSVALWSLAAAARGLTSTIVGFNVTQFGLGLAEGGNFPAAIKTVTEWFPSKERALATGIFNAGSNMGAIVAPVLVPFLTIRFGWEAAFLITGLLGFVWVVLWLIVYRSPDHQVRLGEAELAYIRSDPPDSPARVSWLGLLRYRATWATVVATLVTSPVWWFYLFWVPGFLYDKHGVDLKNMGPPLVAVYLISDVGSVAGGWLSSSLLRRGWTLTAARKTALLACALCVIPVFFAAEISSLWGAVAVIGLAAAAHQGWSANLYTLVSDLQPRKAVSTVVGMGGAMGSVAGMFVAKFVGYILDKTHSYTLIFAMAPAAYLLAFLAIHLLVPRIETARVGEA